MEECVVGSPQCSSRVEIVEEETPWMEMEEAVAAPDLFQAQRDDLKDPSEKEDFTTEETEMNPDLFQADQNGEGSGETRQEAALDHEQGAPPPVRKQGTMVMKGSFVPRTMFNFDPPPPQSTEPKTKKATRQKQYKAEVRQQEPEVASSNTSIFSQTTMNYLKSSGLHSKRIENLLMKYLGPQ